MKFTTYTAAKVAESTVAATGDIAEDGDDRSLAGGNSDVRLLRLADFAAA